VLPHEVPLEPPSAPWSELVPGRRASLQFERRFEPNAGLRVYQVPSVFIKGPRPFVLFSRDVLVFVLPFAGAAELARPAGRSNPHPATTSLTASIVSPTLCPPSRCVQRAGEPLRRHARGPGPEPLAAGERHAGIVVHGRALALASHIRYDTTLSPASSTISAFSPVASRALTRGVRCG